MSKIRFLLLVSAFSLSFHAQDLISHKPPVYLLAAKAAGIEGPVTLKGTVSKEGKMEKYQRYKRPTGTEAGSYRCGQ